MRDWSMPPGCSDHFAPDYDPWYPERPMPEVDDAVLDEIFQERERQRQLGHGGDTEEFDRGNTRNDWCAYIMAYAGRAAEKVFRNKRENCDFRSNMVKVAALAMAAIQAEDKGYTDASVKQEKIDGQA